MTDDILQFVSVTLPATDRYNHEVAHIEFNVRPGDCVLVRVDEETVCPPLADAATGLAAPVTGRILFEGQEWETLSADEVARNRSRIGRMFEEQAWVSNLDVDENVTLAQRHHARRSPAEIRDEALRWARRFGRDALLSVRPAWAPRRELLIAQWIRAFVGAPPLLIFERPTRDVTDEECRRFLDAVRDERARGAGVLIMANDERLFDEAPLSPTVLATVKDDRWESAG